MLNQEQLSQRAINLLLELISTPSFSKEEDKTSALIEDFFKSLSIPTERKGNNVWAKSMHYDSAKPTLLLNSHHDTVKPNPGYTRDPFKATIEEGKIFGLGSNDAGGSLVALIAAFVYFYEKQSLRYNIVLASTAEEEISGANGIELIWPLLPRIDFAIVGEPTLTDVAIAEKGLLVLDCVAHGKAGHAAREEGENAIYSAMEDIAWFRSFQFPKTSSTLGRMKMSVTVINGGQAHNQVPAECTFTVDIRVTDAYTLEEVLEVVRKNVTCSVTPRSMRLRSSGIRANHPLAVVASKLGKRLYGSPTTSDCTLIPVPSIKVGPGDSARSHSANEFIHVKEIEAGVETYIRLIEAL